jgi:hypothetical protein
MAATALTPRVRIMAICDRVRESKIETDVFNLIGVRQGIMADGFPFVPSRLWVFVLLSSPRGGEFPAYIAVVNDTTNKVVFYAHLKPKPTFGADGGLWAIRARIRCSFPEAGHYSFQIWFFQEQGSDVVKGEVPFVVTTEGSNL